MSKRIIGFDHGQKRIGVAIGNSLTTTSQGLDSLPAQAGIPIQKQLDDLIKTWRPDCLVVGLPLHMDGKNSAAADRARTFGQWLQDKTGLPVHYIDERLSSSEADLLLAESQPAGKSLHNKRRKRRDSLAAELILQTYFNNSQGRKASVPSAI